MAKKRTFGFDEFKSKLDEGIDKIGFRTYEHEEENDDFDSEGSIDDLGEGEELDVNTSTEDIEDEPAPESAEPTEPDTLDTGSGEDVSLDSLKGMLENINKHLSPYIDSVKQAESGTLQMNANQKEKIKKIYDYINGL